MYQPPYPAPASHSPQMISVSPQAQGFQHQQYGSNRVMYPMPMYYQSNNSNNSNQFRGGDYDENAVEDEELKEEKEDANGIATIKDTGGANRAVTMNLLNLPASDTMPESISAIVEQILRGNDDENRDKAANETTNDNNNNNSNSNKGDNKDKDEGEVDEKEKNTAFPLPIDNFKIYKYPDQELCWCSFQLTDGDKLDLLITKLNGYVFHGSILKCFVQPPQPEADCPVRQAQRVDLQDPHEEEAGQHGASTRGPQDGRLAQPAWTRLAQTRQAPAYFLLRR
ncbi:hypothetical protein PMKS-001403 [Pichia membranifaciens]|uniref:Uncharacterized protein n=1 Tax=Pichia membranifaciens TaxID=4926 RepID=A0A1Q2YEK4_9ASCO|nr:hypothetical protein PMKS-001403 [Pichia membranifaciens]